MVRLSLTIKGVDNQCRREKVEKPNRRRDREDRAIHPAAGFAPFARVKWRWQIIKMSKSCAALLQIGLKLRRAAGRAPAPDTSAPWQLPSSGRATWLYCLTCRLICAGYPGRSP